jgi:hypothetical protein
MTQPKKNGTEAYYGELIENDEDIQKRFCVGIPMTGLLRSEWVRARYGQVTPPNWSFAEALVYLDAVMPLKFSVAEARNIIANKVADDGTEWLLFIDHDVMLPPGTLFKLDQYMKDAEHPIVSGLYFTKGKPAEPLIYRGNGIGYYGDWKFGDKVMASGCGLGITLIHCSIFRAMKEEVELYEYRGRTLRRYFRTPTMDGVDEETGMLNLCVSTEDIDFYENLKMNGIYKKAGWPEHQKMKYPILVDTSIYCKHIDMKGTQYPAFGEDKKFMPEE